MCGPASRTYRRAARLWEVDRLFIAARGRTVLPDPLTHVVRDCHYSPLFITDLPVIQKPRTRSSLPRQAPFVLSESYDYPPHLESR